MVILDDFFTSLGIHLVRTPTYSPELNGIEKLFGFLKSQIYRGKARNEPMEEFLNQAIPLVSQDNIVSWTRSCVYHVNFD